MRQVPHPGAGDVAGATESAEQDRAQQVDEGQQRHHGSDAQQPEQLVVGEHGARFVAQGETLAVLDDPPLVEALPVSDLRRGTQVDRRCRDVGSPAQIDVLTEVRDRLREAAEGVEQVGAHEHAGVRDREHLSSRVVLGLIQLARLCQRRGETVGVDRVADGSQLGGPVPVDELGTDDAGVGPERFGHQRRHRALAEAYVIVEDEVEGRSLDRHEHLVRCGGEPSVGVEALHERGRQDVGDALGRIVLARVVQDEHRQVLVVLRRDRLERVLEPVTGIRGDEHGHHRRSAEADERFRRGEAPLRVELRLVDLDRSRTDGGPVLGTHGARSRSIGSGVGARIGLVIDRGNGQFLRPGNVDGTAGVDRDRDSGDGRRSAARPLEWAPMNVPSALGATP